jgi:hypothetical protein
MKTYSTNTAGHAMRKIIILTVYLVSVVVTVYFVQAEERGGTHMALTKGNTKKALIPEIDVSAPASTETATFALG